MDLHGNTFHGATVECDFEFAEVIQEHKDELWRRLLKVYFKDEPVLSDILKDEEKWDEFFDELLSDDDPKESFEEHFYRQLTHRYAGTLYGKTTVHPERIVRQIALFVGTYYITQYLKSSDPLMTPEHKLKCMNTMLKIKIRSLGKDLERRDDLCDDLLNEIFRHEKKIEEKAFENDELILKNKSRLAKIKMLREELRKLANPPKGAAGKSASAPAKPASGKPAKGEKSQGKKKEKQQASSPESTEPSDCEDK